MADIRRLLLAAYDAGKRSLPWREETDPYRIWVSEVMLQQTRVETVIPYYERWLERFPDIEALAEAQDDDVLRAWQGLGYYSRARRLHQGARIVKERYSGTLPRNSEGLRELPGVGQYTAGAVASIAFGEAVPALDGNVKRVFSRLYDLVDPRPADLQGLGQDLVDRERPGDFNQALMELGALTCLPRTPRCEECPLETQCLALARGTVGERPSTRPRKTIPEKDVDVLVASAEDGKGGFHFLLRKRPDKGLLAGMWEFPDVGLFPEEELGMDPTDPEPLPMPAVSHTFSHLKVRYRPRLLRGKLTATDLTPPTTTLHATRWVPLGGLDRLPLPVAQQKIAREAMRLLGV
ncbi:MAG: A/G-specific adenine glycosylase [Gemmatimonadetes bacterium]|nr:A/G-specific adenine glycosylase [Gemmatimonadota bacterium]